MRSSIMCNMVLYSMMRASVVISVGQEYVHRGMRWSSLFPVGTTAAVILKGRQEVTANNKSILYNVY